MTSEGRPGGSLSRPTSERSQEKGKLETTVSKSQKNRHSVTHREKQTSREETEESRRKCPVAQRQEMKSTV